jgi:hypothetical protein
MNNRIFELAKQGELIQWDKLPSGTITPDYESVVKAKRFALLIVAECGVALSPMLRDMISRGQAYDLIKQHFGVEE